MTERMTSAELRSQIKGALGEGKGRASKYNAQRTEVDGISFDSKREAKRYRELRIMEMGGLISDLRLQVPIMLEGRDGPLLSEKGQLMRLTVDFSYVDGRSGLRVYEDAKGMPTRDYLVRKAVVAAMGIEVVEV
jgi:hypothetical protein